MKKIKAFFYTYYKSISSVEYYKELLKTDSSFSIKYYVMLIVIASLISTTAISFRIIPSFQKEIGKFGEYAKQYYPEDLVFKTKGGDWEVNKPEPYIYPIPEEFKKDLREGTEFNDIENIIVLDKSGTINDVEKYKTVVLVNKTNIIVKEREGLKIYSLKEVPDFEVNREMFNKGVDQIYNIAKYIPYLVIIALFAGFVTYYVLIRTIYLFIVAGILWIVAKISQMEDKFGNLYRVAMHTMTVPVTLSVVLDIINKNIGFGGWFLWANLILAGFVLFKIKEKKVGAE